MRASRTGTAGRSVLVLAQGHAIGDVGSALAAEGYLVHSAGSDRDALAHLRAELPDLLLLETSASDQPGFLRQVRATSDVPVVVLGPADETVAVAYLEAGADDYLARPYSLPHLASRLRAVLRRAEMPPPAGRTLVRVDDYLQIDFERHLVMAGGRQVALRPTEYRLLYHLVSYAGRVLSHPTLMAKVWGIEHREQPHYLRLYVSYLRGRIEPDPAKPRYILSERGVGYRFAEF